MRFQLRIDTLSRSMSRERKDPAPSILIMAPFSPSNVRDSAILTCFCAARLSAPPPRGALPAIHSASVVRPPSGMAFHGLVSLSEGTLGSAASTYASSECRVSRFTCALLRRLSRGSYHSFESARYV